MNNEKVVEFLLMQCRGCVHPQSVGWCENNCEVYAGAHNTKFRIKERPVGIIMDDGYVEYWNCPNCMSQHSGWQGGVYWLFDYCPDCGKHILWDLDSEEEK